MAAPIGILRCGRLSMRKGDGWKFPEAVRRLLIDECESHSVVHFFGGKADFGVRLDIDPIVRPDVVGNAFMPPFERETFDIVVLDPPYAGQFLNVHIVQDLFAAAALVARKRVIWVSSLWVVSPARCSMEKAWLVRPGRSSIVRCLQFFSVPQPDRKLIPTGKYTHGPALRYKGWTVDHPKLFSEVPA